MQHWDLYIDESGDFGSLADTPIDRRRPGDDDVVVAGVLMDRTSETWSEKALRRSLVGVAPWLPRPLHMAHVNRCAMHAVALVAARRRVDGPDDETIAAAKRCVDAMRSGDGDLYRRVAARVRKGETPRIGEVVALDRFVDEVESADRKAIMRLVRSTQRTLQARIRAAIGDAIAQEHGHWVVATEAVPGGDRIRGDEVSDRYLGLLVELVARCADQLTASGGEHTLHVSALTRDVFDAGTGLRRRLHADVVRRQLVPRLGAPGTDGAFRIRRADGDSQVTVHIGPCESWTADVHPLHVCADVAANTMRGAIRRTDLAAMAESAQRRMGLYLRVESLPNVATGGTPGACVARARVGAGAGPSMECARPLARAQAEAWMKWYEQAPMQWEGTA